MTTSIKSDVNEAGSVPSRGKTIAYAVRRVGSYWPGAVWCSAANELAVPPGYERVRMTIEVIPHDRPRQ